MKTSSTDHGDRESHYSEEFKQKAVALTEEKSISAAAKELGISCSLLIQWRQNRTWVQMDEESINSLSYQDLQIAYEKLQEEVKKQKKATKELREKCKKVEADSRALRAVNSAIKKVMASSFQDPIDSDNS